MIEETEFTPEDIEAARILFARPATFIMGAAKIEQTDGKVMEFLKPSDLHDVVIENDSIKLVGAAGTITATISAIGDTDMLLSDHQLTESAISLDFKVVSQSVKIAQILGEHWTATQIGSKTLLQRTECSDALLLTDATLA